MENFSSTVSLPCGSCRELGVWVKFLWDQGAAVAVNTTVLPPITKVSVGRFASTLTSGGRLRCSEPLWNFPALPTKIESQSLWTSTKLCFYWRTLKTHACSNVARQAEIYWKADLILQKCPRVPFSGCSVWGWVLLNLLPHWRLLRMCRGGGAFFMDLWRKTMTSSGETIHHWVVATGGKKRCCYPTQLMAQESNYPLWQMTFLVKDSRQRLKTRRTCETLHREKKLIFLLLWFNGLDRLLPPTAQTKAPRNAPFSRRLHRIAQYQ